MELRERVVGQAEGREDGPTLVVFGAVHGNEGAGLVAMASVLQTVTERKLLARGRVLGLVGNRRALAQRRRFVDFDLNRHWDPSHLAQLGNTEDGSSEDQEQRELLDELEPHLIGAAEPVTFLDLHSTSGPGVPFALGGDVLRNRPLAFSLGLPVVLGLDEVVDGAMLSYFCDLGHIGVAIEGGRQGDPGTVSFLESAIWLALVSRGMIPPHRVPDLSDHRHRLESTADDVPPVLEVSHRHVVEPGDEFAMKPGFHTFDPVRRGQILAHDRHGPIRAAHRGLMLLPRYQGVGEDGFYLARPVRPTWLRASAVVRRLQLGRALSLLPGVDRDPDEPDTLVARGLASALLRPDVVHLFGYRRIRARGDHRLFMRRRPDHVGRPRDPKE